jgi:hypothetical protein
MPEKKNCLKMGFKSTILPSEQCTGIVFSTSPCLGVCFIFTNRENQFLVLLSPMLSNLFQACKQNFNDEVHTK